MFNIFKKKTQETKAVIIQVVPPNGVTEMIPALEQPGVVDIKVIDGWINGFNDNKKCTLLIPANEVKIASIVPLSQEITNEIK